MQAFRAIPVFVSSMNLSMRGLMRFLRIMQPIARGNTV
jgi:hypothetical protein